MNGIPVGDSSASIRKIGYCVQGMSLNAHLASQGRKRKYGLFLPPAPKGESCALIFRIERFISSLV